MADGEAVIVLEEAEVKSLFPAQNDELVQLCYSKQSGVIYEEPSLQIGVKVFLDSIGETQLQIYFGNKTTLDMLDCIVSVADADAFYIERDSELGFPVPSGSQIMKQFVFRCIKPFNESPSIRLSFTHNEQAEEIDLTLPILLSHYVKPVTMTGPTYINGWSACGNEVGPTVCEMPIAVEAETFNTILEDAMHMYVVDDVDGNADIRYGVGTFVAAPRDEAKEPITIACFIRIETKPGLAMFRTTVRSGHKLVSQSVLYSIATAMAATIKKT